MCDESLEGYDENSLRLRRELSELGRGERLFRNHDHADHDALCRLREAGLARCDSLQLWWSEA